MCKNCGSRVGPFYTAWKEKGEIVIILPSLCKNTKSNLNRISECVARREKIDNDKYKEQLNAYA